MHDRILNILEILKSQFLTSPPENEFSIFLCGGNRKESSLLRRELGNMVSNVTSKYKYSVFYPEDIFFELLLGNKGHDLLSLENLLADSVNCVVILLQSPGTFTELGAFANYPKLKDKLVVLIDSSYAHKKSFINSGPVKYLKNKTESIVIYTSLNISNIDSIAKRITESVRVISKYSKPVYDIANPILAYRFYLALIYVFEPISLENIKKLTNEISQVKDDSLSATTEAVISSLINERKILFSSQMYSSTLKGINEILKPNNSKRINKKTNAFLTDLRIEALNLSLRKKFKNYGVGYKV